MDKKSTLSINNRLKYKELLPLMDGLYLTLDKDVQYLIKRKLKNGLTWYLEKPKKGH